MKINNQLTLRKLGSRYMIADTCSGAMDMAYVHTLNEPAAFLWQKIGEEEFTPELLAKWLCEEYEVEEVQALADVNRLLADWKAKGFLQNEK